MITVKFTMSTEDFDKWVAYQIDEGHLYKDTSDVNAISIALGVVELEPIVELTVERD